MSRVNRVRVEANVEKAIELQGQGYHIFNYDELVIDIREDAENKSYCPSYNAYLLSELKAEREVVFNRIREWARELETCSEKVRPLVLRQIDSESSDYRKWADMIIAIEEQTS